MSLGAYFGHRYPNRQHFLGNPEVAEGAKWMPTASVSPSCPVMTLDKMLVWKNETEQFEVQTDFPQTANGKNLDF